MWRFVNPVCIQLFVLSVHAARGLIQRSHALVRHSSRAEPLLHSSLLPLACLPSASESGDISLPAHWSLLHPQASQRPALSVSDVPARILPPDVCHLLLSQAPRAAAPHGRSPAGRLGPPSDRAQPAVCPVHHHTAFCTPGAACLAAFGAGPQAARRFV